MKPSWLIAAFFAFSLIAPSLALGQIENSPIMQALSTSIRPEYPKANELVEIGIRSSAVDLNVAHISWRVNGEVRREGIGERSFSFITGPIGSVSRVIATITPYDKAAFSREFVFRPAEVDLVWEAYTYTPPFYKGKALFTGQSVVRFSALPRLSDENGNMIPASNLTYRWMVDGKVLPSSGYGRSSVGVEGSRWGGSQEIQVEVTSRDGQIKGIGEITLTPEEPRIAIYENNPILGILWNRAVAENFILNSSEVSFLAVPYHFISSRLNQGTEFSWKMNGRTVPTEGSGNLITLRNDSRASGKTNVTLDITQEGKIFQSAETSFSILYEN